MVQLNKCATITICHIFSKNVKENFSNRILLISVTGKANLITADYLKEQAVVIDIGICCKVGITGNVAFDEACKKLTVLLLFRWSLFCDYNYVGKNVLKSAKLLLKGN